MGPAPFRGRQPGLGFFGGGLRIWAAGALLDFEYRQPRCELFNRLGKDPSFSPVEIQPSGLRSPD